jgi:RimJ/RimL family protein N-acetyltransferase
VHHSNHRTPEISLRPLAPEDQVALNELAERVEVSARIGETVNAAEGARLGIMAITTERGFAGIVGIVASQALDGSERELVCALLKRFEGEGIATEACRRLLSQQLLGPSRTRVLACIASDNTDGKDLARRLGFTYLAPRGTKDEEIWERACADIISAAV